VKVFARLVLAGLAVVGCPFDGGAADITATIDSNGILRVSPRDPVLYKSKSDVLTWHFLNESTKTHKVLVCPISADPLTDCGGPLPAKIREQFRLMGATLTGTNSQVIPKTGVASCNVDYSVVVGTTGATFKYCVVAGLSTGDDLKCECPPNRASELEINVEP
jgi:hypothetical protein